MDRISAAARRAGREPGTVTLVAASKTQSAEAVAAAVRAGVRIFGENRVQEARRKIPLISEALQESAPWPSWHMIGHLQTNKARAAAQTFSVIQSVDSLHLAESLNKLDRAEPLAILLEVYVGSNPSRPGLRPDSLRELMPAFLALPNLTLRGLMTVAPLGLDGRETREVFQRVRVLRDTLIADYHPVHFRDLSMGMSEDFELAIDEGSTMVRVGRALFGERVGT